MRKALFTLICLFAMLAAGTGLKAQEIMITLNPGWTWIGYTNAEAMSISAALGTFVPMEGDILKSKYSSTTYSNGQWRGRLQQFTPGLGYHYYSMRGEPVSFVFANSTPQSQVTVTTSEPLLITAISAMGGGEVTVSDGTYILVKGLCWATHENPTTNDDFYQEAESGVGTFSVSMTGLNISTTYYVRAYAVTANGTVYGDEKTFTTRDGIPTVTTAEVTDITGITATCGGDITDNCGLSVIACGVCWSTSPDLDLAEINILESYDFENGLIPTNWINDVTYPWILSQNTSSGNYCIKSGNGGVHNSTSSIQLMVEFDGAGAVGFDALCQGESNGSYLIYDKCIFSIDGEAQFIHGAEVSGWNHYIFPVTIGTHTFEWSYTKDGNVNPTEDAFSIDNVCFIGGDVAFTAVNGSTGNFSSGIDGLTMSTTYYVRAYATTSAGTGYGDQVSFTTRNGIPTVTTAEVTSIGSAWACNGGNITDDGGLAITARGVCWSTSPSPTLADAHTSDGNGAGSFSSYMTGLSMSTTYYVRAYATNSFVTVYGNQLSFTTTNEEHVYVDLGLPSGLLWAICNVGADWPEAYGDYFAWGETQPKDNYTWSNYQYCNGGEGWNTLTKYCFDSSYGYNGFTDNLITLLPEDDAATANWGSGWRMPTKEEWQELCDHTTVTYSQRNGVPGRLFTAANGNSLFLPAAGGRWDDELTNVNYYGYYLSSSLDTDYPSRAWIFNFYPAGSTNMCNSNRESGFSVRPVREN